MAQITLYGKTYDVTRYGVGHYTLRHGTGRKVEHISTVPGTKAGEVWVTRAAKIGSTFGGHVTLRETATGLEVVA